ncbi:hypothetical protein B0H17DRAFT_1155380, partial [Mycena rosella]
MYQCPACPEPRIELLTEWSGDDERLPPQPPMIVIIGDTQYQKAEERLQRLRWRQSTLLSNSMSATNGGKRRREGETEDASRVKARQEEPPKKALRRPWEADDEENLARARRRTDSDEAESPTPPPGGVLTSDESPTTEGAERGVGVSYEKRNEDEIPFLFTTNMPSNSEDARTPGSALTLTDTEDKAFKRQALDSIGILFNAELQRWLDRYIPLPAKIRPPRYAAGALVRVRVQERACARRARVNHLMRAREGWASVRSVLRVCLYPVAAKESAAIKDKRAQREEEKARKA